ncbi:uncharacterized protein LOC127144024 isoform X1 [Cucumis melo]|uniref:Uncharacterized protein LOC127144024 isoform X1 n=1 Tax=Cucumis melo TaxID=3656 RepID=A0ABM3KC80_CUCME|nr:uncharacterized protein LOC127144024 isoform X1 [Cucumis melo]
MFHVEQMTTQAHMKCLHEWLHSKVTHIVSLPTVTHSVSRLQEGLIEILRRRKEAKLCLEGLTQSIIGASILMFLSHRKFDMGDVRIVGEPTGYYKVDVEQLQILELHF